MTDRVLQPDTAEEGLILEADLFAAEGPRALVWYAIQPALVCPRAYRARVGFDASARASARRGWPVYLRPTGGGCVPQGAGIANLALAFNAPKGFTIEDGYRLLVAVLQAGLPDGERLKAGDTPGSFCDGAWNLSFGGQKLVGTAQRWRPVRGARPRVLAHAIIITSQQFHPGAEAVANFHADLGLPPISPDAHTSLQAVSGSDTLIGEALCRTAIQQISERTHQTDKGN